ncbi:MAG: hypothetical protein GX446_13320 [Chthonomonadales bacterium]|nr:hypothetical protein [Chthonomonadales bacterium]
MALRAYVALGMLLGGTAMANADTVSANLNGLTITFDRTSGAIVRMEYPGPGVLLDAGTDEAGLVDMAYPLPDFEALRLRARCSTGAVIEQEPDRVTIRIPAVGASRAGFSPEGAVAATVVFRADGDGRSIILSCEVKNGSGRPVPQVIFPDLRGLVDVAGPDHTIFKTCGFGSAPFRELVVPEVDVWYAVNNSTVEHKSGGMFHSMWARWMDLGGLNGGFSLFPRRWGWDPQTTTYLQMRQATKRLRLLCVHPDTIAPGATWSSGEWVLTPHASGWAKGIEPFRAWVRSHAERKYAMPRHIREGLGYRTVWMCQSQPQDPTDAVWRFGDLPELAREAADHGLTEMVMWAWQPAFDASLPAPFPHLGTEQELVEAARACREAGVRLTPFISVLQANPKTAGRYGLKVTDNNGWTYHTEMIPRWNPPYAAGLSCVQVGPHNQQWQDEVATSFQRWAEKGLASVSWDQYWTAQGTPSMQDLTRRIRDCARALDPESSFSGESLWNVEVDCEWLDYTWNWGGYADRQGFVNAFPGPRPNANINRSEAEARFAFMDNLILNVWPSKPDSINGSERIANVPALSQTLKTCAALRRRFLPYFTEGVLIGACLMTEPSPGVRLSAYVRGDRAMAIVLNQGADGELSVPYDLNPWIAVGKEAQCTRTSEDGVAADPQRIPSAGKLVTPRLRHLEMVVYEFTL